MKKYACSICRYVYDPGQAAVKTDLDEIPVIVPDEVFYSQSAHSDADDEIEEADEVVEVPDDWVCPQCGSRRNRLRVIGS